MDLSTSARRTLETGDTVMTVHTQSNGRVILSVAGGSSKGHSTDVPIHPLRRAAPFEMRLQPRGGQAARVTVRRSRLSTTIRPSPEMVLLAAVLCGLAVQRIGCSEHKYYIKRYTNAFN